MRRANDSFARRKRFLSFALDVFGGRHAEMLAEDSGEVSQVGEAYGIGHLGDVDFLLLQQTCGLLQTDVADELAGGDARQLLHLAVELCAADAHLLRQHVDVEVAVGQVLVDGFHDALHQQLVVALHLGLLHAVGLLLCAAVLAFQALAVVDEALDVHVQLLHVEGLGQEGVGAALQSLQAVAHVGLRGEHDDGDVGDVDVGFDHAQHGEAVHLGHHDVADDHVVVAGQQFAQSLLAVGTDAELVVAAQLGGDVMANLQVVVDDEHAVA